ncbi:MAG: YbaK/EbsC family protein [Lentisphaerae bacterium]|nr:YbaK/EbsC family protein [Lentisphaerota bacterium]
MDSPEENILKLLTERQVPHAVLEHPPVYTNAAMAQALGVALGETVKNIMLETSEGEIILVVLPGDQRFDAKRLSAKAGTKRVSFAKPDKVKEFAGCEVGCVPPFGHVKSVRVFLDPALDPVLRPAYSQENKHVFVDSLRSPTVWRHGTREWHRQAKRVNAPKKGATP